MRRSLVCLLLALALLLLAACGDNPKSAAAPSLPLEASLLQKSAAITRQMGELAADPAYYTMMSSAAEIAEVAQAIGGFDYTNPGSALVIALPENLLDLMAAELEGGIDLAGMSDTVRYTLNQRLSASLSNMLAGQWGAYQLAAVSLFSVGHAYQLTPGLEGGTLVFLFYEGNYCSVTSFAPSEEGTMQAVGSFVPVEEGAVDTVLDLLAGLGLDTFDPIRYEGRELADLLAA